MGPTAISMMADKLRGSRGSSGSSFNDRSTGDIIPKGYTKGRLSNFDEQQKGLYNEQFSRLGPDSFTSRLAGGDQSIFDEIEAPALRQFTDISANIANRFSGQGIGGRRSSGFQNAQTAAGSNFAQQLQANRQQLMRQALQDIMGYSNTILGQRPYEQDLFEKQQKGPSAGNQFLQGLTSLAGGAVGSFAGPLGTAAGTKLGDWAGGQLFGGNQMQSGQLRNW